MTTHQFHCVDPESFAYPRPYPAILPYLSRGQFALRPRNLPYFLRVPHIFLQNGRNCLAHILARAALAHPAVLVPGYICKSVLEPIIWSGYRPIFYKLHRDLSVDRADFQAKIRDAGAAIVTHYFGNPQALGELRALCTETGTLLIEDCAHAFLGEFEGRPLGSVGDFAIASTVKFSPGVNGGLLIGRDHAVLDDGALMDGSTGAARSFASLLAHAAREHRVRAHHQHATRPYTVPTAPLWREERLMATEPAPRSDASFEFFDPGSIVMRGDQLSYWILRHLDYAFISQRRSHNYETYRKLLAPSPRYSPLLDKLPDKAVPYMFPLYVTDAPALFRALKFAGIPFWRWEQQHTEVPEPGTEFGYRLLQLPCHQCFDTGDIERICERLLEIIARH